MSDFNFTTQIFALPHLVALESYVKAFQCKVTNSILYINTKLLKIGYKMDDLFATPNLKICLIFSTIAHFKRFWIDFIGTFHRINKFPFL